MKRVRVTLEVDETFVKLLRANCQLSGWIGDEQPGLTPSAVLAMLVLGEAMGATELQIHEKTPPTWRPHIEVLHDRRQVVIDCKVQT